MFLISGGKYSKSLSPKYKARRVSRTTNKKTSDKALNRLNRWQLTEFEEISGQDVLVQVVVRQIQHFEDRECAETAEIKINGSMSRAAESTNAAKSEK
jgi:hypothetical protein